MERSEEFGAKLQKVREYLDRRAMAGVVLARSENFAWLGCGASNVVNSAQETGVGALVVAGSKVTLVTNNIEVERLLTEELDGLGISDTAVFPWHEPSRRSAVISELCGAGCSADDGSAGLPALPTDFASLRYALTDAEVERYGLLGTDAAAAMEAAGRAVAGGMTERDVAALVQSECMKRGIATPVLLVAADDRIRNWRHPVVKDAPVEQYVMMVICGRRQGLIAAVTRLVHFGELPDDLRRRHNAVCTVDAAMIAATRPGQPAASVFARAVDAYAAQGFDGEWQFHHQGGATGYQPREYIATPECKETIADGQAFAWNPSIRGTKSEDTVLVTADGFTNLTATSADWPTVEIEVDGQSVPRADILCL